MQNMVNEVSTKSVKSNMAAKIFKILAAVMVVLLLSVTSAFASEYLVSQTDTVELEIQQNEHRFLSAPVVDEKNCTYTWSYCAGVIEELTQEETTSYINLPIKHEKKLEVDASMVQQYQISPNLAKFRCVVSNFDGDIIADLVYKVQVKTDIAKSLIGLVSGAVQTDIADSDVDNVVQNYNVSPNKENGTVNITVKYQDEKGISLSRDTVTAVESGSYFK